MRSVFLYWLLAFCLVPAITLAAETTTPPAPLTPEEAAVRAATALLNARTAQLQAERTLQATIDAPAEARRAADQAAEAAQIAAEKEAKEKRDQRRLDTITAISDLSSKVGQGTYAATQDGVATPKAMELAFSQLDNATAQLRSVLADKLDGKIVIFVDAIPGPSGGYELKMYQKIISDLSAKAGAIIDKGPKPQVAAAALIPLIPGILNAISGFFRSDYTEKVFDSKLSSATAASALMGKLITSPTPPSTNQATGNAAAANKATVAAGVFLSVEAYSLANANLLSLQIVQSIGVLQQRDEELAAIEKTFPPAKDEEAAVVRASASLEETTTKIKNLQYRRDFLAEYAKAGGGNASATDQLIAEINNQITALQTGVPALKQAVENAKTALTEKTKEKDNITQLREQIGKILTALKNTEGTPPLFVRLVRDAFLASTADTKELIRYVSLSVASSPQGVLSKKNVFGTTAYGSSFLALEYRVAAGDLQILAAGVCTPATRLERLRFEETADAAAKRPQGRDGRQ